MNKYALIFLVFITLSSNAQNEPWIAYWNEDTTKIGFKDTNGEVKIDPKFIGFTTARVFDDIIAVIEENNGDYKNYYLTKSGKKVGKDSLYVHDNASDCESEGFIRFRSAENEMVGMFDKNGNVSIPAEYNALSRVENGLIVALKGARKDFWKKHNEAACNHFTWKGGKQYLIDTTNQILIENFEFDSMPDLFSLTIDSAQTVDPLRISYQGVNGSFYSFTDFEKDFNSKIISIINTSFSEKDFDAICYDSIYYWKGGRGWISESKTTFIYNNFTIVKDKLMQLQDTKTNYNIFIQGLNPYLFKSEAFVQYFNNCNEAKETQYPVMNIVIDRQIGGDFVQDHFDFLKTDKGYKLISMSIGSGKTHQLD